MCHHLKQVSVSNRNWPVICISIFSKMVLQFSNPVECYYLSSEQTCLDPGLHVKQLKTVTLLDKSETWRQKEGFKNCLVIELS